LWLSNLPATLTGMGVHDFLADGDLDGAIRAQRAAVAADPSPRSHLLLAELLLIAGEFRGAFDLLGEIVSDDPGWPASRRHWRNLVRAANRRDQLRRGRHPLGQSLPRHARHRVRVGHHAAAESHALAARHADAAEATSPELSGHADGQEFAGLRDLDDRFGSVLEVLAGPRYVVVPLERLASIVVRPAEGVADLIYRPAELHDRAGNAWACTLPLTYPGSHRAGGAFALGLETDCVERGEIVEAIGSRVWLFGDDEASPGEFRRIDLRAAGQSPP
jgi:type VI secretion system protein ImpE